MEDLITNLQEINYSTPIGKKNEIRLKTNKNQMKKYWPHYLLATVCFIMAFIAPIIFTWKSYHQFNSTTGFIGDTIGGLTAPFLNLAGSILVFAALRAQIDANRQVQQQFEKQEIESRFFELVKLHRENVSEIGIGNDFGKKIFVMLIREFRLIHKLVIDVACEQEIVLSKNQAFQISYNVLFFGIGENSSRQLKQSLAKFDNKNIFFEKLETVLKNEIIKEKEKQKEKRAFKYIPFRGHQSRLGHYYRHLYQTVTFIDKQKISIEQKYDFVKVLRAQLTTHEQALLFINSQTFMGRKWYLNKNENLLKTYKMVKNIPLDFFDKNTEIDLTKYFDNGYFEYQTY